MRIARIDHARVPHPRFAFVSGKHVTQRTPQQFRQRNPEPLRLEFRGFVFFFCKTDRRSNHDNTIAFDVIMRNIRVPTRHAILTHENRETANPVVCELAKYLECRHLTSLNSQSMCGWSVMTHRTCSSCSQNSLLWKEHFRTDNMTEMSRKSLLA